MTITACVGSDIDRYKLSMHILDLPPELLAQILVTYVRDGPQLKTSRGFPSHKRYNVLFVCQQWYSIALECSEMWSVIILPSTFAYTKAMVERSKNAPLHIGCMGKDLRKGYHMDTLKLIFSQNHRIIHLEIPLYPVVLSLLSSFPHPFPLPIARYIMTKSDILTNDLADYPFSAPALRSLHAESYSFQQLQIARSLPSTIRHLTGGDDEEELREFLEHLRSTPLLEELVWHPPLPTSGIPHQFRTLSLQHLTILNLTVTTPDLRFLKYLSCPSGVSLTLSILCDHHALDVDTFSSTVEYAFAICRIASACGDGEPVRMVKVLVGDTHSLAFWTTLVPKPYPWDRSTVETPRLNISVSSTLMSSVSGFCHSFTSKLDLSAAETLILVNHLNVEGELALSSLTASFAEALFPMCNIYTLITTKWCWGSLKSLLTQSKQQIIFPRLETIHVSKLGRGDNFHDNFVLGSESTISSGIQRLRESQVVDLHLWGEAFRPVFLGQSTLETLTQLHSPTKITLHR